ncbi:hypothetical protein AVEN_260193-1 [Araneus ventricosus]|uniref:Uncharacterized protein n=1 Tax=Araneus ventricosus TaxID=182803 RepID=A0A4Y2DPW4_ARAVE|nr:hypothetical protein AVEN_260193-1 [Araneus ventricosus]
MQAGSRKVRDIHMVGLSLNCRYDIPNVLHRIKIRRVSADIREFNSLLNHSNTTEPCDMGVVLLEDSISSWEELRSQSRP